MPKALKIAPPDDVLTMLEAGVAGDRVAFDGGSVQLIDAVERGHKVALHAIERDAPVRKFGFPIGRATRSIAAGEHVHVHNLQTALAGQDSYAFDTGANVVTPLPSTATFMGYRRADGRVGTRNEIWVLPTVGCVARTAERIARQAEARVAHLVDGVHAFAHPHGCSQLGHDLDGTRAILASLACHPNAAGAVIVGLGCEENQVAALLERIPQARRGSIRFLVAQASADEVAEGVALVEEVARAATAVRSPAGLDALVLGVKCGGSDGLSGLTANPLVGRMADHVTGAGGSAILTEIPEIFGAEHLLMERAASRATFDAIVTLVNGFKQHFIDHGEPVSENPSPGNIAGGITTLEEKSLGAVQKGGTSAVVDVIDYGVQVRARGLTVLEAPGNDAVSSTALAAAGATVILFTTGRGTPLGFPVPTVKIASNHDLAARKPGWIDFDAGMVLDAGMDAADAALLQRIIAIASGEETAAERNGEREIAIWKRGVTL
jgi:altronate hydrolase